MRGLVGTTYAGRGRPSIDFFEGLRSERQLLRVVADRLSLRSDPRLRPDRSAPRPLESDPHPRLGEDAVERVRGDHAPEDFAKALRKRQVRVEPRFAEAKDRHGLRRFRLRGLPKVTGEAPLIAAGQNLKR